MSETKVHSKCFTLGSPYFSLSQKKAGNFLELSQQLLCFLLERGLVFREFCEIVLNKSLSLMYKAGNIIIFVIFCIIFD